MSKDESKAWQFWADRGGTFTDVVGVSPNREIHVAKVLSEIPEANHKTFNRNSLSGTVRGIRQILKLNETDLIPEELISQVRVGTTLGTNALLERKGSSTVFITTKGFADLPKIRQGDRQDIFLLNITKPRVLFDFIVEVNERILSTGEVFSEITDTECLKLLDFLTNLRKSNPEVQSCAICFMHAYRFPEHEEIIFSVCQRSGFENIFLSHRVDPVQKFINRAETTLIDAYLTPVLKKFINKLSSELTISECSPDDTSYTSPAVVKKRLPELSLMKSDGSLSKPEFFSGKDSLLSGPAGGAVGALKVCQLKNLRNLISLDIGGTSTDVCHILNEEIPKSVETEIGGVTLTSPCVAVKTIAAGGGSIVSFDPSGRLTVGPRSAGAFPGPACYRMGGPLTITDCNLLLGRIQPSEFPAIFGVDGDQQLDVSVVRSKMADVRHKILQEEILTKLAQKDKLPDWLNSIEGVAENFIEIAIQQIASATRKITSQKGIFIGDHTLCCFGGAGGQHACRVAEVLGIRNILIDPLASVLSAVGIGLASTARTKQKTVFIRLNGEADLKNNHSQSPDSRCSNAKELVNIMNAALLELAIAAKEELERQNVQLSDQAFVCSLRVSYRDVDTAILCHYLEARGDCLFSKLSSEETETALAHCLLDSIKKEFLAKHFQMFGFLMDTQHEIIIISLAVESMKYELRNSILEGSLRWPNHSASDRSTCSVFLNGEEREIPLMRLWELEAPGQLTGPVLIVDPIGTNLILPGWDVSWDSRRALMLTKKDHTNNAMMPVGTSIIPDPFWLEFFNNYYRTIAELMGDALRETSQSVNIKERLDFSCAIFNSEGELIANAPHIPVHLGSMGEIVKSLIKDINSFVNGSVYASNNPFNGGTHLPDITVITPLFAPALESLEINDSIDRTRPWAFVASRGHHVDVGGIVPGSMPANSRSLDEEGIVFDSFLLVDGSTGELRETALRTALSSGTFPARSVSINVADIRAQIAANHAGIIELNKGVRHFGLLTMRRFMSFILDNGERCVRAALMKLRSEIKSSNTLCYPMDGGSKINVKMEFVQDNLCIDFTGTSATDEFNYNAPTAIVKAAILYFLRCLLPSKTSVPLNDGCLRCVEINLPSNTLLNPRKGAAVAAGNVEVSQCIVNALFGCIGKLAASQGTMNNVMFGNESFQYYETICGGAGAGVNFDGAEAVQTHMTNSRLTDPELFECRMPVVILSFSIRQNSGGAGHHKGGDGVIREILFRQPVTLTILAGSRVIPPFGLSGGLPGKVGRTLISQRPHEPNKDQQEIAYRELPSRACVRAVINDILRIETPGGGGYGILGDTQI